MFALAASYWTEKTLEIDHIHKRLLELEVAILPNHSVAAFHGDRVELACVFTGRPGLGVSHDVVGRGDARVVEAGHRGLQGQADAVAAPVAAGRDDYSGRARRLAG